MATKQNKPTQTKNSAPKKTAANKTEQKSKAADPKPAKTEAEINREKRAAFLAKQDKQYAPKMVIEKESQLAQQTTYESPGRVEVKAGEDDPGDENGQQKTEEKDSVQPDNGQPIQSENNPEKTAEENAGAAEEQGDPEQLEN